MKRYLLSFVAAFALIGTASAGTLGPADVEAIAGNLGPTVEALADGLGNTVNNLIITTIANGQPSAVQTSADLGNTVVGTASALIAGAPNLGAAGLLPLVANSAIQQTLHPILNAIDNPTSANIQAALALDDLNTIAKNLEGVPFAALEGPGATSFNPYGGGLREAAIGVLQGNVKSAVLGGDGAVIFPGKLLVTGTNYQPIGFLLQIGGIALNIAGTPVFAQLQGPATQLATAGAPVTDPVVGILQAGF